MVAIFRVVRVLWVFFRFGIFEILKKTPTRKTAVNSEKKKLFRAPGSYGARLREALVILGPVFIKFGQLLSTRRDILNDEIVDELCLLQDDVPPFPAEEVKRTLEQEFGKDSDGVFSSFSYSAVASASIAQVHRARLIDGTEVAVKIIRPNIEKQIARDIRLLRFIAKIMSIFHGSGKHLRANELVDEFAHALNNEIDLINEASNAVQLSRLFKKSRKLLIPRIHWPYCTSSIIVMDWIDGISIKNKTSLAAHGISTKKLAAIGVEIFFTQVFRYGLFHADMHPGNIFILNDGRYAIVDFGIVGTLSDVDKNYLAENFIAFFNRDYKRVAVAHIAAGWAPPDTRVDLFEAAIRSVCEPIFDRPIKEISFSRLLARLFNASRAFNIKIQPQLLLLQKTLFNIEGLGRELDPDLDLWGTGKPYLEKWMSEQFGMRAVCRNLKKEGMEWMKTAPQLPRLLHEYLSRATAIQTTPKISASLITSPATIIALNLSLLVNVLLVLHLILR